MMTRDAYKKTRSACYLGFVVQAVVNGFAPMLFLTFQSAYGIPLQKITLLISVNFLVQLTVDLLSAGLIDRIGVRRCMIGANALVALGLLLLGILPEALHGTFPGLLIPVILYATGGGLIEVLGSPIVESCEEKQGGIQLLHAYYCWGYAGVIVLSTLFFAIFGIARWRLLSILWALLPLCCGLLFLRVPLRPVLPEGEQGLTVRQLLKRKLFWLLLFLMLCAGAAEQAMEQWLSAFCESGLRLPKTVGDLLGPCLFALCMGAGRVYAGKTKTPMHRLMMAACGLCIAGYLLAALSGAALPAAIGFCLCGCSVAVFWPGALSLGAKVCPMGGTAMFALLALAGDVGCTLGPDAVGFVSAACGSLQSGLLAAAVFPLCLLVCLFAGRKVLQKSE